MKSILKMPINECIAALNTRWKCHATGGVLSLALLGGMVFMRSLTVDSSVPMLVGAEQITEDEARQLHEHADDYRRDFLELEATEARLEERKQLISMWLRSHIDPLIEQERISFLARKNNVRISTLKPGQVHTGSRIAVWSAQCEIRSTCQDMCRWINALSRADSPIACRSIELRKVNGNESNTPNGHQICHATVELRVPFRGEDTAAARIKPISEMDSTQVSSGMVGQPNRAQLGDST